MHSNMCTSVSVLTLPEAPGAYGQPPRPAHDASKRVAPASSAASALASAMPRVSCRWIVVAAIGSTPRRRSSRRRTPAGSAMPVVSHSVMPAAPPAISASAMRATSSSGTSPSNGQPNAHDSDTLHSTPPWPASRTISQQLRERLGAAHAQVGDVVRFAARHHEVQLVDAGSRCARSMPRRLGTSAV